MNAAKQQLIAANLRLVVTVAARYKKLGSARMPLSDLIQEGAFALVSHLLYKYF
jgi:DNA-directed RNA polymerase sigma subunit (sigma70/sigma32)